MGHVLGPVGYAHGLRLKVRPRFQDAGEPLQSPLDPPCSEEAQHAVRRQDRLRLARWPGGHDCAAHSPIVGTRRRMRTTMNPRIAPGMLLDKNAIWNHHNV
jgi:hypothetical protein